MKSCLNCGDILEDRSHGQTKKYCSQVCLMRTWRKAHPEDKQREARYFQDNKLDIQPRRSQRHRERYQTDIQYRLKDMLRSRLLKAVDRNFKTGSAVKDLGCSIEEFKRYLESKFKLGMNWDNQGKGKDKWNIDHIVPLKDFDLTVPEELRKVCHYTNLQPLWEVDHYKKTQEDLNEQV